MAASAISNLLRKNVGAGLARVSLNKNIIRNYFSLVFSVDKRAFKRRVWFDFKYHNLAFNTGSKTQNIASDIKCLKAFVFATHDFVSRFLNKGINNMQFK